MPKGRQDTLPPGNMLLSIGGLFGIILHILLDIVDVTTCRCGIVIQNTVGCGSPGAINHNPLRGIAQFNHNTLISFNSIITPDQQTDLSACRVRRDTMSITAVGKGQRGLIVQGDQLIIRTGPMGRRSGVLQTGLETGGLGADRIKAKSNRGIPLVTGIPLTGRRGRQHN